MQAFIHNAFPNVSRKTFDNKLSNVRTLRYNVMHDRDENDVDYLIDRFDDVAAYLNTKKVETAQNLVATIVTVLNGYGNINDNDRREFAIRYRHLISQRHTENRLTKNPDFTVKVTKLRQEVVQLPDRFVNAPTQPVQRFIDPRVHIQYELGRELNDLAPRLVQIRSGRVGMPISTNTRNGYISQAIMITKYLRMESLREFVDIDKVLPYLDSLGQVTANQRYNALQSYLHILNIPNKQIAIDTYRNWFNTKYPNKTKEQVGVEEEKVNEPILIQHVQPIQPIQPISHVQLINVRPIQPITQEIPFAPVPRKGMETSQAQRDYYLQKLTRSELNRMPPDFREVRKRMTNAANRRRNR
jgi:quinol monooxygenase YgiN